MSDYDKLINDIRIIREEMIRVGGDMATNYDVDEIREKGREMLGAAGIAQTWINGIMMERDKCKQNA